MFVLQASQNLFSLSQQVLPDLRTLLLEELRPRVLDHRPRAFLWEDTGGQKLLGRHSRAQNQAQFQAVKPTQDAPTQLDQSLAGECELKTMYRI